ncbi:hypothetical protein Tco_0274765, partial [Tanacetum coccineum]
VVIDKFELVSSVKLGRNKDEGNLSEEHHDQDDHNHTVFVYEDSDATDAVTSDLERKSLASPEQTATGKDCLLSMKKPTYCRY